MLKLLDELTTEETEKFYGVIFGAFELLQAVRARLARKPKTEREYKFETLKCDGKSFGPHEGWTVVRIDVDDGSVLYARDRKLHPVEDESA